MHKIHEIIKSNKNGCITGSIYELKQLCLRKSLLFAFTVMFLIISLVVPASVASAEETPPISYDVELTELTDTTKDFLDSLNQDIEIYYVVQDSDQDAYVKELLNSYASYSPQITLFQIDQEINPDFVEIYTDEIIPDNSVIIVCGDKSRVVPYDDMYEYEFDYSYYSYVATGFDAEGQITSVIIALTTEELLKLYALTGHDELELTTTLDQEIKKENIEVEDLNLVTADAVPDDADALLIASPTSDFSDMEAQRVVDYLQSGGSAILITDYLGKDLPNFDTILEYCDVELIDGVVMEADANYYIQIPYYLVPIINNTEITEGMSDGSAYVLLAGAQGVTSIEEGREDLIITGILTTSKSSYSKTDVEDMTSYQKESGDIDGPFDVGVLITERTNTTETKVAVFTSSTLIDDTSNSMVSGGNYRLFINALDWACNNTGMPSVPVKKMYSD